MKKIIAVISLLILVALVSVHFFYSYRSYNVILITIDTLRADYIHCYNPGAAPTPGLDRIAKQGVLFSNAYTLIPITMPSHTSILTSRQPFELGLFNNGDRFDHRVPLLSDLLKQKHYATSAFVSLGVLNGSFGLAGGFDYYDDDFRKTNGRFYKTAAEVSAAAIPWIEKQRNRPFFAWIHYSDPHEPYVLPDAPPDTQISINGNRYAQLTLAKKETIRLHFAARPGENSIGFSAIDPSSDLPVNQQSLPRRFIDNAVGVAPASLKLSYGSEWVELKLRSGQHIRYFGEPTVTLRLFNPSSSPVAAELRFSGGITEQRLSAARRNYASEVQYLDRYIGRLWQKLSDLGILDNTIVIVAADHGEGLKTHGLMGHVDMLWNETTRIPFLIYYPHLGQRGKRVGALVNLLDIMPTVLDLLHIKNQKSMEGISLKKYVSRSPLDRLSRRLNRRWTYSSTFYPEAAHDSFSITDGRMKLVRTPGRRIEWEAYDLVRDPIEKRNLARVEPARFNELGDVKSLLEKYKQEADLARQGRRNPQLSPEEQQMLRNLGYIGGDETPDNER